MRALGVTLVAVLLVGAPTADGKRKRLRGTVTAVHGKAPASWRTLTPPVVPAPVPAPIATPTPVVTPTPTPTAGSSLPVADPHSVSVSSTEFDFVLSQAAVDAGELRVQFDNSRAEDPHQLSITGPDPDAWRFDEVAAGGVVRYTITVRPGRHVFVCPLPGHEELGMRATLTVR